MRKRRSRHRAYKCMRNSCPLVLAPTCQTYRWGAHRNGTCKQVGTQNPPFWSIFYHPGHHLGVIFALWKPSAPERYIQAAIWHQSVGKGESLSGTIFTPKSTKVTNKLKK